MAGRSPLQASEETRRKGGSSPKQTALWARSWASASLALDLVLGLRFLSGLPLHVARRVRATTGKRHSVVYHVPGPAVWMPGLSHNLVLGGFAAFDAAPRIRRGRARRRGPAGGR